MRKLIFVDVEANGKTIGLGEMTEFGAVSYPEMETFYGNMTDNHREVFEKFALWLGKFKEGVIFVSDNPAFDFCWINYYFHHLLGYNPFGWSARRIGDYFSGLTGNFRNATKWKKWRRTPHDHNPINDAMGNAEAFAYMEEHKDEIRGIKID